MFRLIVTAIGRAPGDPLDRVAQDYAGRTIPLARQMGIDGPAVAGLPAPRLSDAHARLAREAELLRGGAPPGAEMVRLDERGRDVSSTELARLIADVRDRGAPALQFVIGGADGLSPDLKSTGRAIAFGRATWPHLMVRAMLCEQLYRAVTIMAGHPYHRA